MRENELTIKTISEILEEIKTDGRGRRLIL